MHLTKVHLFVVLLLALVGCSFLGGSCRGGAGLEGFNMPSDTHPYKGTGQYSDKYSGYGNLYSANDKYSKQQDVAHDRIDPLAILAFRAPSFWLWFGRQTQDRIPPHLPHDSHPLFE